MSVSVKMGPVVVHHHGWGSATATIGTMWHTPIHTPRGSALPSGAAEALSDDEESDRAAAISMTMRILAKVSIRVPCFSTFYFMYFRSPP